MFDNTHSGLKHDPDDSSEQLVIVGERAPGAHKLDLAPIADDIRAAIAVRHGVTVRDVLLTPAGAIPRTSSGKIGRRACRAPIWTAACAAERSPTRSRMRRTEADPTREGHEPPTGSKVT